MKSRRYVEPIAEFARRALSRADGLEPPYRAIFLTHDLDLDLFERDIAPLLVRRNRAFRTLIVHDAKAPIHGRPAATYELVAALVPGASFHPKLWVLQAATRWCVGIGSSNLTSGGLGRNLEVMSVAEGDPRRDPIPMAVAAFLARLAASTTVRLDRRARRALRRFVGDVDVSADTDTLRSSLDGSLLDQIARDIRHRRPVEVHLVSPPYAGQTADETGLETTVLGDVRRAFPGAAITVYTEAQGRLRGVATRNYVGGHSPSNVGEASSREDEVDEALAQSRWPSRLHAKLYLLRTHRGPWRLYAGSANLTVPGLLRRAGRGGNLEVLRGEDLTPRGGRVLVNELQRLFDPVEEGVFRVARRRKVNKGGRVLDGWEERGRVFLALTNPKDRRPLTLRGPAGRRITVKPIGETSPLRPSQVAALGLRLPLEAPARVEEIAGSLRFPFFVSPSIVAPVMAGSTIEEALKARVDELRGLRVWSTRTKARSEPTPEPPGAEDEDTDPVTALTITSHDAQLDKLAKLVIQVRRALQPSEDLRARLLEDLAGQPPREAALLDLL